MNDMIGRLEYNTCSVQFNSIQFSSVQFSTVWPSSYGRINQCYAFLQTTPIERNIQSINAFIQHQ